MTWNPREHSAISAINEIRGILYPNNDPDHTWSSNEIEWIAEVVNEYTRYTRS